MFPIKSLLLFYLLMFFRLQAIYYTIVILQGDDAMDIAALSISMKQSQLAQSVSLALVKKVLDVSAGNSQNLIKMMEHNVNPNLGGNIDLKV